LKHNFGLVLRTRGLRKAQVHADLVMLTRLSQALSRSRSIPHPTASLPLTNYPFWG